MLSLLLRIFKNQNNMDRVKICIATVFKKLVDSNKSSSIKYLWRLIMLSHILIAISLVFLGWIIYAWVITTTPATVVNKRIRPPITIEEIDKANEIVNSKKDKLDEVLGQKVEIVGLK